LVCKIVFYIDIILGQELSFFSICREWGLNTEPFRAGPEGPELEG